MCYINQLFFFVPCIVINEQRVENKRHFMTCRKIKSKTETENRSRASILCCSGDIPKDRDAYDGPLEKFPKVVIKAIVREIPFKVIILLLFGAYFGISLWGTINLKQGLELRNLANSDSYYYKYSTWDNLYFRLDIPISFIVRSEIMYSTQITQNQTKSLLRAAKSNKAIDTSFEINWLAEYKNTRLYNDQNETTFVVGLKDFLNQGGSRFKSDIVFDTTGTRIQASRFYVISNNVKDTTEQGEMMNEMRSIASSSELLCFAYTPAFVFFEQYVQILKGTLQTVGIAVAVMVIITTVFMPQPVLIVFVFLTMIMILVGIFGFMYYWDLTLSSVTMIHLVMTVGFSVDFSAHICHAFVSVTVAGEDKVQRRCCLGKGRNIRDIRVEKAIDRSGGPIINAALSSVVGILMLTLSTSYIFQSFFKLMLLVILFGLAHSVLFLPVLLSLAGPRPNEDNKEHSSQNSHRRVSPKPDYPIISPKPRDSKAMCRYPSKGNESSMPAGGDRSLVHSTYEIKEKSFRRSSQSETYYIEEFGPGTKFYHYPTE